MTKKTFFGVMPLIACAVVTFSSCNKSPNDDDKAKNAPVAPASLKIAYVEVDSIMTQYTFCKETSEKLEKKQQNVESTLQQKGQALQQAAANFQQKLQSNGFSTREQAEQVQAGLQKQNADLENLQQRLAGELQQESAKFNEALHDSLQHFLNRYNKDKKYTLILSKSGDNILYGDKAIDITDEVIEGLNKAYKK